MIGSKLVRSLRLHSTYQILASVSSERPDLIRIEQAVSPNKNNNDKDKDKDNEMMMMMTGGVVIYILLQQ